MLKLFAGTGSLLLLLVAQAALAHGYVDYPKARQQICKDDGGYWWPADGSGIPNLACRAAYQQSGGYALTQHHEYSTNVPDYHNQTAVRAALKNGLLCAGGDSRKSGMDVPSAHWQRTVIDLKTTPQLRVRFRATTPHNPSFWQFYLSNPSFDAASSPLSWEQLTLIHQQTDVPAVSGYYEIDVPLPKNRSGNAVLYTRWQRQDVVGEGFYNCSDLQFSNGDSGSGNWYDKGTYLSATQLGKAGETALLRVFDSNGQELLQKSLLISSANQTGQQWAWELAQQVNAVHSDLLQIGVLNNGQISLQQPIGSNRLYLRNATGYANLDLKPAQTGQTCGGVDPLKIFVYPNWPRKDEANRPSFAASGDYMSDAGKLYQAKWWTQSKPGSDGSWQFVCSFSSGT